MMGPAIQVFRRPNRHTTPVLFADGSFSLPSIAFASDPDTGLYRVSSNVIGIVAGTQLGISVTSGQINLLKPVVFPNSSSAEFHFTGDTQTELRSDHTMVVTVDHDNDATGNCTFEVHGGLNGMRMRIHDDPLVIQIGPDTNSPTTQEIKSGDGLSASPGWDFRLKAGESAGTDQNGASLILGGGQCTGAGVAGTIQFQTAAAGASATTVRSLVTRMTLSETALTFAEGRNLVAGTTTGTKIGVTGGSSGEKWAFFGATPIVQPLLATGGGATVDNVITALQNLGLVRQS